MKNILKYKFKKVICFWLCLIEVTVFANIPGGGDGTGANVTLVNNGDGTVTMNNGVVTAKIKIATAQMLDLSFNGQEVTTGFQGANDGFYWQGSSGSSDTLTTIVDPSTNGGNYAIIQLFDSYTNNSANANANRYFAMFRGSPGIYASEVMEHTAAMPSGGVDVPSLTGKLNSGIFNWLAQDTGRNQLMQSGSDTTISGIQDSPKEVSLLTSGQLAGQFECKYNFSGDLGSLGFLGWCSTNRTTNFGIWMIHPSNEYFTDGPMHKEILAQMIIIQATFAGVHYGFHPDMSMVSGENWSKVNGPFFIYFNQVNPGTANPQTVLYTDAQAQTAAERGAWPYSWFTDTNYFETSGRGVVSGQMMINDIGNPNASASNLWVGLIQQAPSTDTTPALDFQSWGKTYQYWIKSDASGNFIFSNVVAGTNYTLFAFGPGAIGQFQSQTNVPPPGITNVLPPVSLNLPTNQFSVTVTAGATTNLGAVTWTPTRVGSTVWEMGVPDRDTTEFRHGNDYWHGDMGNATNWAVNWMPWQNFNSDFPSGVNFVFGQSHWAKDWDYAHGSDLDPATGNYGTSTWTVSFNLPNAPTNNAPASIYFGIAASYAGPVIVKVNGTDIAGSTGFFPPYSDSGTADQAMIRMGSHGIFSDYRINFASSLLHAGVNTITFNMRNGGYFSNMTMYDYIRLELAGYVPPVPPGLSASAGNSKVSLWWPSVPGATSYNVMRSGTSGSGYTNLATNVIGPTCGSVDDTAAFTDTNVVNGTTYYYVVRAVNPNGSSSNSVQATASPLSGTPTAPTAPANLAATAGNNFITLNWNASAGAASYVIQRTVLTIGAVTTYTPGGINPYATINSYVTGTNYTDTALANNVIYSYQVSAANANGQSTYSPAVNAMPTPAIPNTPTGLSASVISNQITVSWSLVTNASSYIVSRATVLAGPYTIVDNPEPLTSFSDAGLNYNTTYYYKLAAASLGGISTNSAAVSKTTTPPPPAPVAAVPGNAEVSVHWSFSSGATNYVVYRSTSDGGPYSKIGSTTNSTYLNSGLVNGTTYYYVVDAVGLSGTSPFSVQAAATPSSIVQTVVTATMPGATIANMTGTLVTSGNFDMNGGNAVALLFTSENVSSNGVISATFAGQPMTLGIWTNQTVQWSGIFYLINPPVTSGQFVVTTTSTGQADGAYSVIALANIGNVADVNAVANTATSGTISLAYTTHANWGFVLGACVNNGFSSAHPAPVFVSGNATNTLLPSTIVDGNDGHLHTYGIVPVSGSYTDIYTNLYQRNAYVTLAFDTVDALADLSWSVGSGIWDINTTSNWNNGTGQAAYQQFSQSGNPVHFEDSLSGNSPIMVTLNTAVYPLWVIASNNTKSYIISGSGGMGGIAALTKAGNGTLTLSNANTYGGGTTINGGTVLVDNNGGSGTGTGVVTVNPGGTLGGIGLVSGTTTVNSGGTFAPGLAGGFGALTINDNLGLANGSTNLFQIQHSPMTNSMANVSGTLFMGGTIIVTNVGASALANGDNFKLFNAANFNGGFTTVVLPPLNSGLAWNTNLLCTNGTLSVVVVTRPVFNSIYAAGNNFVFSGGGGVGNANYYLLGATNLTTPLTNWNRLLTNQFDVYGNFNFTNTSGTGGQQFYRLQIP